MRTPLESEARQELLEIVGEAGLLTDPEQVAGAERDWTGRWIGSTPAVIRPGSAEEVAGVVAWCRRHGRSLVPQGGNTGLVGGGVPLGGELVLSTARLTGVIEVDDAAGQVTAPAGTTIGELQAAAAASGWAYGIDLASRDSATVGGTIATNAGGVRVLRHGATRAQLLGVDAVLGTGQRITRLGGLVKDNTGYDLAGLLCGSEGTLGIVTAARLRLVPRSTEVVTALVAYDSVEAAVRAGQLLRGAVRSLEAVELITQAGLSLVCEHFALAPPLTGRYPAYLLVEAADDRPPLASLEAGLRAVGAVDDVAVATEPARRAQLWRYREGHTDAVNARGVPHKLDVTLPPRALAPFISEVPEIVRRHAPTASTWLFGHVADGNIHVNVVGVPAGDRSVDDLVLTEVVARGGSISAEHGIGVAKRPWLLADRGPATVEAYRAIKRALDPSDVCNPNVLLP